MSLHSEPFGRGPELSIFVVPHTPRRLSILIMTSSQLNPSFNRIQFSLWVRDTSSLKCGCENVDDIENKILAAILEQIQYSHHCAADRYIYRDYGTKHAKA